MALLGAGRPLKPTEPGVAGQLAWSAVLLDDEAASQSDQPDNSSMSRLLRKQPKQTKGRLSPCFVLALQAVMVVQLSCIVPEASDKSTSLL